MTEPRPAAATPALTSSGDASRLDLTLLRYVLLHRSRMNMLALDRELQSLRGDGNRLQLAPGSLRSDTRHRIPATLQLAVELQLADSAVLQWVDRDALRRQMAIDAAYYPSQAWLEGQVSLLRAVLQPAFSATDWLASAGARHFKDYLLKRTRLQEDDPQAAMADPADPADDTAAAALPPATLAVLAQVAAGVVALLQPQRSADDWRALASARAHHPGFHQPLPEVFDALLLGHAHALLHWTADGPAWRYAGDGRLHMPIKPGQTPDELGALADAALQRIDGVAEALSTALGWDQAQPGNPSQVFALLADRWRVLPTSPAWADVARAQLTWRQADAGRSSDDTQRREADAQVLQAFDTMLQAELPRLLPVLRCGALLDALVEQRGQAGGLLDQLDPAAAAVQPAAPAPGLQLLAEGLQFAHMGGDAIAKSVAEVSSTIDRFLALQQRPGGASVTSDAPDAPDTPETPRQPPAAGRVPLELATLQHHLQQARSTGLALRANTDAITARAWASCYERLIRFARDGSVLDADAFELVCAAAGTGPACCLTLNPQQMRLQAWSAALLRALNDARVPVWLAAVALQRLGAGSLSPAQQNELLAALQRHPPRWATPGDVQQMVLAVRQRGVWGCTSRALGSVLVVRKANSPLTEAWDQPPKLGLVLIGTAFEIEQLALAHPTLLRALPRPLRLEWEEPLDLGTRAATVRRAIRFALAGTGLRGLLRYAAPMVFRHTVVAEGFFHPQGARLDRQRNAARVRDPAGPDTLLAGHLLRADN